MKIKIINRITVDGEDDALVKCSQLGWVLFTSSPITCLFVAQPCITLVAQMVKCLPTMRKIQVQSLGQEDLLEKEMATHSSTLAWKTHERRSLVGYSP